MENKKYVIFVSSSQSLGGADFSMFALIKKFKLEGINALVICREECKSSQFFKDNGVEYLCVPYKQWFTSKKSIFMKKIYNYLKKLNNIILTKKVKKILKKYDVKCIYNNSFTNNFAMYLAKEMKTKYIQHIREFGVEDFGWSMELGKFKQYEEIERRANLIITISNAVKESFSKSKGYNRIKVIYNGVKESDIKDNLSNKNLKIIISGRLSPEKGHMDVIEAIKQLVYEGYNQLELHVYGDGILKNELQHYIDENQLNEYIELKGFVLGVPYKNYDIGIMASTSEAFGRVTAEYMINGLATVAANSGANAELIEDGKDGLLYKQGDVNDLVEKIKFLYKNKDFMLMLEKNAKTSAYEKYTEDRYTSNVYNYLCENKIFD